MSLRGAVQNNGWYILPVDASPNGDYFCPKCKARVCLSGSKESPFFRHPSKTNCALYRKHRSETREHFHAKHLLKWALDNKDINIDGVCFPPLKYDPTRNVVLEKRTNTAKSFVILDVAIVDANDDVLYAFEIRKSHATDMASRCKMFRAWEIDHTVIEAIDPSAKEIVIAV